MAAKSEKQISLKLIIDKKNDKVVFAECNGDFVGILFGFLTLPMGTIVRLINKQSSPETIWSFMSLYRGVTELINKLYKFVGILFGFLTMLMGTTVRPINKQSIPETIGSFTSLYRGVTELSNEYFRTGRCKAMLLSPNNSSDNVLQKLKINIDDTVPRKYFAKLDEMSCPHVGVVKGIECPCGYLMANEIFWNNSLTDAGRGGVFINPKDFFIITDDLQVMPASSSVISSLFQLLGINDSKGLHQKTVNVSLDQICGLLKASLLSKSTLTDVFLRDQCIQFRNTNSWPMRIKTESKIASIESTNMSVKLTVRKTDKKIIYAEANEDFIDLLFSLLTIPVGLVVQLLGGNSSVTCLDNLYKSVDMLIDSEPLKEILVAPKLPPLYLCKSPLLDVVKHKYSIQLYCVKYPPYGDIFSKFVDFLGVVHSGYKAVAPEFIDPKSVHYHESSEGYVKKRATFMVTDDLVVTPFSSFSMISLAQGLDTNISCLEERVVHVGIEEALSLLQASLISGSALTSWIFGSASTTGLATVLKEPKKESSVP